MLSGTTTWVPTNGLPGSGSLGVLGFYDGVYIAVEETGQTFSSTDGINFDSDNTIGLTQRYPDVLNINGLAFGDDEWIAFAGYQNDIYSNNIILEAYSSVIDRDREEIINKQ